LVLRGKDFSSRKEHKVNWDIHAFVDLELSNLSSVERIIWNNERESLV